MVLEAFGKTWLPADKGSDILFELEMSDIYTTGSGKYFDNDSGSFSRAHAYAYDDMKTNKLIKVTNEILDD